MPKLFPAGAFDISQVAIIAPPANPAIQSAGDEEYLCYNCGSVIIKGTGAVVQSADILLQCADCKAYNQAVDSLLGPRQIPSDRTVYRLSTAYRIPLGIAETSLLGQITAAWGQLDEMTLVCIAALLKVNLSAAATMLESQTSGPRVNMLKRLTEEQADPQIRKMGKEFHEHVSGLVDKRNHLMHGIWGYYKDKDGSKTACRFSKSKKLIFASDLLKISGDIATRTKELVKLMFKILGRPQPPETEHPDTNPPLFFGSAPSFLPETWTELFVQQPDTPSLPSDPADK